MNYVNTKNESSFSSELLIKYMNLLDYKIEPKQPVVEEKPESTPIPEPELVPKPPKSFKYKVVFNLVGIVLLVPYLIYVALRFLFKRSVNKSTQKTNLYTFFL